MVNVAAILLVVAALILVSYQISQQSEAASTSGLTVSDNAGNEKGCIISDINKIGIEDRSQCNAFCGNENRSTDYLTYNSGHTVCSCVGDC